MAKRAELQAEPDVPAWQSQAVGVQGERVSK